MTLNDARRQSDRPKRWEGWPGREIHSSDNYGFDYAADNDVAKRINGCDLLTVGGGRYGQQGAFAATNWSWLEIVGLRVQVEHADF